MDSNTIKEDFLALNNSTNEVLDVFDRIKVSQKFNKDKIAVAKMYINAAKALIVGNLHDARSISPKETEKIVALIHEIASGKRMKLFLELSPDRTEIVDLITKKSFKLD